MKNEQINTTISLLKSYDYSSLYRKAGNVSYSRAYQHYLAGAISTLKWSAGGPGHILTGPTVSLHGVHYLPKILFSPDGKIGYSCSCTTSTPLQAGKEICEHIACLLLTLINLLSPDKFPQDRYSETYRNNLLFKLTQADFEQETPATHREVVTIDADYFGLEQVTLSKSIPSGHLAISSTGNARRNINIKDHKDDFSSIYKFFNAYENHYPVILKSAGKYVEINYNDKMDIGFYLEAKHSDGNVVLSRHARVKGNERTDECSIIYPFIYHERKKEFTVIRPGDQTLDQWGAIYRANKGKTLPSPHDLFDLRQALGANDNDHITENTLSIAIPDFNIHQLDTRIGPAHKVTSALSAGGSLQTKRKVSVVCVSLDKRAGIPQRSGRVDNYDLKIQHTVDGKPYAGFGSNTAIPLDYVSISLHPYMRRQRVHPCELLPSLEIIALADNMEKRREALKSFAAKHTNIWEGPSGDAVRIFAEKCGKSSVVVSHNEELVNLHFDIASEARVLMSIFNTLGPSIYNLMSGTFWPIESQILRDSLGSLVQKLNAQGVQVYIDKIPVVKADIRIEIDVNRDAHNIDWFEVKPAVYLDGDVVPLDEIRENLFGNTITDKKNYVKLVDDNTKKTIEYLGRQRNKDQKKDIVSIPRMQILDWCFLQEHGAILNLPEEDRAVFQSLLDFKKIEPRPLPKMNFKPRNYQKFAYYWLSFLYEHRLGACLADDMGLGKTAEMILLLAGIHSGKVRCRTTENLPHLVVAPTSNMRDWAKEISTFYPKLKCTIFHGDSRDLDFKNTDVIITTYGMVARHIDMFKEQQFHVSIFDEAQMVKNIHCVTAGACRQIKAIFRASVTGTPLENHIGEYYSTIDLCLPGILGEYDEFRSAMKGVNPLGHPLIRRTVPFRLRRTKNEVLKDLPPKIIIDEFLDLSDDQRKLYTKTAMQYDQEIDEAYREMTKAQAGVLALSRIMKLRQLCLSIKLFNQGYKDQSPKCDFLVPSLQQILSEGNSALIFSQFTKYLDIVEGYLAPKNIPLYRIDGSTSEKMRHNMKEQFQGTTVPEAFLLSLKAGGKGITLTKASYVFLLDPWWNPAVEQQAMDRAHRLGQKNKVTVFRLIMKDSIEEKIMQLKGKKMELFNAVMGVSEDGEINKTKASHFTREDFKFLLGA